MPKPTQPIDRNPQEIQATSIRIPNWLRLQIREHAQRENRSWNNMAEVLLTEAVKSKR